MSDNIDYDLQATYGAEFFDYDAASGEYHGSMLSSDEAEDFGTGNIAWNETWDGFPMTSNDHVATCETFDSFASNDTAWPEMDSAHSQHQPSSTTTLYHRPEHSNFWTSDSSNPQNNDYASQSSAPTEAHDHPNFDTLQQTDPGSPQWHAQDQQLQGSSMVLGSVLPVEGHQSEGNLQYGATANPQPACRSTIENLVTPYPQRVIRCDWASCITGHYVLGGDEAEARHHLTTHKDALLQSWNGPTTCGWPNCSSARVFKDRYALSEHITNIHVAPLHCSFAGCSVGLFGKKSDLKRHIASIHGMSGFLCPIESCKARTTGFSRKDKLVKHLRDDHDNIRCSLNHCGAVVLDGQQEVHVQKCHGDWECALMACQHSLPSYFTQKTVRIHLVRVHKMNPATAAHSFRNKFLSNHIVTSRSLGIYPIKPLAECQGCLELAPKPQ